MDQEVEDHISVKDTIRLLISSNDSKWTID
jgi:hypothetical protein